MATRGQLWHTVRVRSDDALTGDDDKRPIVPWRLVAGAFLHFAMPLYLIAIIVTCALMVPHAPDVAWMVHRVLQISPGLIGVYAGFALLATVTAALIDPTLRAHRERRRDRDPGSQARRSERRVRHATQRGRGLFGPRGDAALARLAGARWQHDDPRDRALARDLAETVDASADALATAPPERRPTISDVAACAVERISAAQGELAAARASEDERQARIVAGYVEARYGPSDFSGGGH